MPDTCRHCGRRMGEALKGGQWQPQFRCNALPGVIATREQCSTCELYDPNLENLAPPGEQLSGMLLWRYDGTQLSLENIYRGATAFLVLGGPSVKQLDLSLLGQRGVLIMSYNNNPAVLPPPLRPHIWLHTDPPGKFHDAIWRDPTILKLSCTKEWRGEWKEKKGRKHRYKNCRKKLPDGTFVPLETKAFEQPFTLAFDRSYQFDPATFLTEHAVNRGCNKTHHENIGGKWPHIINTMLSAVRLAYYLGIRRLVLVGADFRMDPREPYAFNQAKNPGGVNNNNHGFQNLDRMFRALRPIFDAAGYLVQNATPGSALTAFERVDYETTVRDVAAQFPAVLDCSGWYDDVGE